MPDGAVSLGMMPDPNDLNIDYLTGRNRLIVAAIDETTEQRLVLYCLHGPYADRVCQAQVFEGSLGCDFYIPLDEIGQWREATGKAKALFQSLEVTPLK